MVVTSFVSEVYLLLAFMAMGSWGIYIGLITLSAFTNSRYLVLRISVTAFGMIAYGLFALASYNVGFVDGNGGLIIESFPMLGMFGMAGAIANMLFLLDSVMKLVGEEAPTGDTRLTEGM